MLAAAVLLCAPLGGHPTGEPDRLKLVLCTPVGSGFSRVGDWVLFRVEQSIRAKGVFIPEGSPAIGKVQRQSKKVAFSLGRVLLKGDTPFASPHAVISISADYVTLPDGRTVSIEIDPAPRTDDHNERLKLHNEYWPQRTMEPETPPRPLNEAEAQEWDRLFRIATDRRISLGKLVTSKSSDDLLHNSLASMRDVLAIRQTVEFIDRNGAERLQEAAKALRGHSPASIGSDRATTQSLALAFAATVEVANLYGRTHRGIRGWERRQQISVLPGVVVSARVIELD
jgi:hypothetical protein